jgi:hypothetical protein
MGRRSSSSLTNFLQDITDDIKDFIDDEIVDRGRDTERDLRRAGRNWFDSDDDYAGSRRSRGGGTRDLHEAVAALTAKVDELAAAKK